MWYIFLFILFWDFSYSLRFSELQNQIVGGLPVDIIDFAYQVVLFRKDTENYYFICGGSILSKTFVLTAAHCVRKYSATQLAVGVGATKWFDTTVNSVSAKYTHPYFYSASNYIDYDAAALKLTYPLVYSPAVKSIKIATMFPAFGSSALISGWGDTFQSSFSGSDVLQSTTVEIMANCSFYYPNVITSRMFCAGYPEGMFDACQGDSGGPVVSSDGFQIGIVSWGTGCAQPGKPGVYTNVTSIIRWIKQKVTFDNT